MADDVRALLASVAAESESRAERCLELLQAKDATIRRLQSEVAALAEAPGSNVEAVARVDAAVAQLLEAEAATEAAEASAEASERARREAVAGQ